MPPPLRQETDLPGICILEPRVFGDARGFFMETYSRRDFATIGIHCEFVQDNHSLSSRNVLRGLHYQLGRPQDKLVRVIRGEVFDVAVDVRRGSPTFGKWTGAMLTAENRRSMFIPKGFAHGFHVLSEVAEFLYKCSDYYAPEEERGIAWNDPQIAIAWPIPPGTTPILSAKDQKFGTLATRPQLDLPLF
ncbi:MAG: dTDP-4-dehydrorhamnose 3,5-epimerase [Lentisphaeria bacterium]|jgi:dTDP-4-dehydrorhamnose 3,5-epimerase